MRELLGSPITRPMKRSMTTMADVLLKRTDLPSPRRKEDMTLFAGKVKAAYRDFLIRLEQRHRAGASGIEIVRRCSAGVGIIVQHLFDSLGEWMDGRARRVPAIIALGGLGRRELSPMSDVDLLFLQGKKGRKEASAFAGYLVRMLWDSGLKLGHSVRTLAELRRALKDDLNLKTGLLDSRWICGDERLKEELNRVKEWVQEQESGELLAGKLGEARRRWKNYGGSYHLLEPNVKESPGGLRDFQTIRWIGTVLPWEGTLTGLFRLAIIDREEIKDIQRAFDFLLRVRNELHFATQSSRDVLTLEMHRAVAEGLGYKRKGGLLPVERFMRDYYSNAMSIYKVLERFLEETRGKGNLRIIEGVLYRRVGTKGLGQIDFRLTREKMREDPLFVFKEQIRSERPLSPHLEQRIRNAFKGKKLGAKFTKRMRESFLEFLQMPGKKTPVIRSMHELGVLGHIFPPFDELTCLKRYDLYHQYTADEHSLQAVSHLEGLKERERGLLPRIFNEVAEKVELYLATLLHDIGKVSMRRHARSGAMMAEKILRSFPLSARSRSLVTFLIENHLLLAHYSQRRDMEDKDTSLQFIRKVRSHLRMKLLYLLTYADLKATGPGVWTVWKESLLEDLYYKASRMLAEKTELASSYLRVLAGRREKVLTACKEAEERKRMERHLDGLPERYAMVVSPAQARSHLKMVEKLQGKSAVTSFRRLRHSIELTICTRDRPFRLSQLCGVITVNDLNILGALAFTRADGIVVDLFHVEGIGGRLAFPQEAKKRLASTLDAVLTGKIDLEKAYQAHVKRWKRRAAPGIPIRCVVEFENDLSTESTIIDLSAKDRPGLLYRVTHILSEEGLDIQSAQITTRGGMAADSFYVRTGDGKKVSDGLKMRSIRHRLVSELD